MCERTWTCDGTSEERRRKEVMKEDCTRSWWTTEFSQTEQQRAWTGQQEESHALRKMFEEKLKAVMDTEHVPLPWLVMHA